MKKSGWLIVDAIIDFLLGLILLTFNRGVVKFLGIPEVDNHFYAGILGAVLFGIGIALLIEYFRRPEAPAGLGLNGAAAINLCGGIALAFWLIFGGLDLPLRGIILLWALVVLLVVLSGIELYAHSRD